MQDIHHNESANICPVFCDGKNLTGYQQSLLWSMFKKEPECPSRVGLIQLATEGESIHVSVRGQRYYRLWMLIFHEQSRSPIRSYCRMSGQKFLSPKYAQWNVIEL